MHCLAKQANRSGHRRRDTSRVAAAAAAASLFRRSGREVAGSSPHPMHAVVGLTENRNPRRTQFIHQARPSKVDIYLLDHTADEEARALDCQCHVWSILNCKRAARMRKPAPVNHTRRASPIRLAHSHVLSSQFPISVRSRISPKTPRPENRKYKLAPPDPTIPNHTNRKKSYPVYSKTTKDE